MHVIALKVILVIASHCMLLRFRNTFTLQSHLSSCAGQTVTERINRDKSGHLRWKMCEELAGVKKQKNDRVSYSHAAEVGATAMFSSGLTFYQTLSFVNQLPGVGLDNMCILYVACRH